MTEIVFQFQIVTITLAYIATIVYMVITSYKYFDLKLILFYVLNLIFPFLGFIAYVFYLNKLKKNNVENNR